MEQAVRKVTVEKERAKNVIIFGLDEDDCIVTTMESVFRELDNEQPVHCHRLGSKVCDVKRPCKVVLKTADLVQHLLKRAELTYSEKKEVSSIAFTSHLTDLNNRGAHQKLVAEMREKVRKDKLENTTLLEIMK